MAITLQGLRDDLRFRLMEHVPDQLTNLMLNRWLNLGQYDVALRLQGINDTWLGERMPIASTYSKAWHYPARVGPIIAKSYVASTKVLVGKGTVHPLFGLATTPIDELRGSKVIFIDRDGGDFVYSGIVASNMGENINADLAITLTQDPVGTDITSNVEIIILSKDHQTTLAPSVSRFKLPYSCMQLVKVTDNLDVSEANIISPILSQEFETVSELGSYNSDVRYTQHGHRIILSKGSSVSYPNELAVWYYRRPAALIMDADQLSAAESRVPEEFQELVIMHAFIKGISVKGDKTPQRQAAITGVNAMLARKYDEIRNAFATERALAKRSEDTKEDIR